VGLKDSEIWETISYVKNVSTSNFAGKSPRGMLFTVTSSGVKLPVVVFVRRDKLRSPSTLRQHAIC